MLIIDLQSRLINRIHHAWLERLPTVSEHKKKGEFVTRAIAQKGLAV